MAPSNQPAQQTYSKDEKVLCFHHDLLYEAKILDSKLQMPDVKNSPMQYRVHYKGWKNTWDDWVNGDRIRKLTDENKELAQNLKKDLDAQRRPAPMKAGPFKKKATGSDRSSNRGSEERHSSVPVGRGQKRGRDYELDVADEYFSRPEIRIPISDHIKTILVDDWEQVTKNLQLVDLPSKTPVSQILATYLEEMKANPSEASPEAFLILEEFTSSMEAYFESALGKVLLYTFEREQYSELGQLWENPPSSEWEGKTVADVYGAEHFLRLIVTMPELMAHTNMDAQQVARAREEIIRFTLWLSKNTAKYLSTPYISPGPDYLTRAGR